MGAQLLAGPSLEATDPAVARLIEAEFARELETICLIPSENYVSRRAGRVVVRATLKPGKDT